MIKFQQFIIANKNACNSSFDIYWKRLFIPTSRLLWTNRQGCRPKPTTLARLLNYFFYLTLLYSSAFQFLLRIHCLSFQGDIFHSLSGPLQIVFYGLRINIKIIQRLTKLMTYVQDHKVKVQNIIYSKKRPKAECLHLLPCQCLSLRSTTGHDM